MDYKRFSLGLISSLVGIILLVWLAAWVMPEKRYLNDDYPFLRQQYDHVRQDSDREEIIILGDSRSKMGILAQELGDSTYNLSLSGATAIEMYYTLHNYLQHHPRPKALIISLSPGMLASTGTYPEGSAYLHYFTKDELDEINELLLKYDNKDFRKTTTCFYYRTPNIYMWPILRSIFNPKTKSFDDVYQQAEESHGFMPGNRPPKKDDVIAPEVNENGFRQDPVVDIYINKILKLSAEQHIPVYYINMPMGEVGHDILMKNGYLNAYTEYMESLAEKYGVQVQKDIPVYEINIL